MGRKERRRRRIKWSFRSLLLSGVLALAVYYVVAFRAPNQVPAPAVAARIYSASRPAADQPVVPVHRQEPLPATAMLNVPAQSQYPQLPNGCEVTSLSMLLTAAGHPVNKMVLAKEEPTDPTKLVLDIYRNAENKTVHVVKFWGNPNRGFVGQVGVANYGYGIYHGPLTKLLNRVLPGRAEDLTGRPFSAVLAQVARGIPVVAWTTTTFRPTDDWVTWESPEGPVHATPLEHAVLIVGYNKNQIFVNNPLNGRRAQPVDKEEFIQAWRQLGEQAVTVRPLY